MPKTRLFYAIRPKYSVRNIPRNQRTNRKIEKVKEVRAGCVVPQTEGKVSVGRDAEVGGLVERSAQRRDQHRRP